MRQTPLLFLLYNHLMAVGAALAVADQTTSTTEKPLHTLQLNSAADLQKLLHYTGQQLPLVSAHRGGATVGLPENCQATCEDALRATFALMEIDPRYTRDGKIVVHHDTTFGRTSTGVGKVAEQNFDQLRSIQLKDSRGEPTSFALPTLDEFLEWARGKCILVLDQKDVTLEDRIEAIQRHQAESYALLIIYSFKDAQRCYKLNPNIMMEVMIPNRAKFLEFSELGIPWSNIIAFVGHEPPQDLQLLESLHQKGVLCVAGTSRNLDKELMQARAKKDVEDRYLQLFKQGIDLIETDLPREVGGLLKSTPIPDELREFFRKR